jgi:hypothetical protein
MFSAALADLHIFFLLFNGTSKSSLKTFFLKSQFGEKYISHFQRNWLYSSASSKDILCFMNVGFDFSSLGLYSGLGLIKHRT